MKQYDALTCRAGRETLDLVIAVSSLLPVTGVLDEGESVTLYFDEGGLSDEIRAQLLDWVPEDGGLELTVGRVEEQNWNAEFERSLEPTRVGADLIITQSWHPISSIPGGPLVVVIDPKMSFGTGHHESTRLISGLLMKIDLKGKRVLDIGTGTGVLAIVAAMRGAEYTLAFDNNEWAVSNTLENAQLNGVSELMETRHCEIDAIPENGFDVVLGNLHRNIIIGMLPEIRARLADDTSLFLSSGVLYEDYQSLVDEAARYGLEPIDEARENEWIATTWRLLPESA